jgi:nucleoside-diphosphate-sugar epimerase
VSRVLTGGAGFIGCHVAGRLLEKGTVAIYDSFINYVYPLNQVHIDNIVNRLTSRKERRMYRAERTITVPAARVDGLSPAAVIHLMPLANLAVEHPEEAVSNPDGDAEPVTGRAELGD